MAEHVTKVFISATSRDLRSVRKLVRDALISMGCLPVVQEHFGPDYRDVSGMLRDKIGECDALIHIAGMRYGAEPELDSLPESTPRRSYTQMEVDLARELKLEKVFTFVCPEEFPYDTTDEKGHPLEDEPEEFQELQRQHRERLLSQKELRYRSNSPEELATQVREIQLGLREVEGELAGTRLKMLKVGAAIAVALALIFGGLVWMKRAQNDHGIQVGKVSDSVVEVRVGVSELKGELGAVRTQIENDLILIKEQLKAINHEKAKAAGDQEDVVELQAELDRRLGLVDKLISSASSSIWQMESEQAEIALMGAEVIIEWISEASLSSRDVIRSFGRVLGNFANVSRIAGDFQSAFKYSQEELKLAEKYRSQIGTSAVTLVNLASAEFNVATSNFHLGRITLAEAGGNRSMALYDRALEIDSGNSEGKYSREIVRSFLCDLALYRGEVEKVIEDSHRFLNEMENRSIGQKFDFIQPILYRSRLAKAHILQEDWESGADELRTAAKAAAKVPIDSLSFEIFVSSQIQIPLLHALVEAGHSEEALEVQKEAARKHDTWDEMHISGYSFETGYAFLMVEKAGLLNLLGQRDDALLLQNEAVNRLNLLRERYPFAPQLAYYQARALEDLFTWEENPDYREQAIKILQKRSESLGVLSAEEQKLVDSFQKSYPAETND